MAQANQKHQQVTLLSTGVDIDPVAVVYNIPTDDIQDFVYNYLTQMQGINGVAAVRCHVVRDGYQRPEVAVIAFLNMNSSDVFSQMRNVPKHLQHKMDIGGFRANEKLKQALLPITRELKLGVRSNERLIHIRLDLFKILGLMLAANPRQHTITVTEVGKVKKKRAVLTVIKANRFVERGEPNNFDRFDEIVEDIVD